MITNEYIGLIGFITLVALLFLGIPIGITMAIVGIIGILIIQGFGPTLWVVQSVLFHESFHWVYIVLPMYILLGNFAFYGDIGRDTYEAINKWLSRVKGNLIVATVAACAAMGFASGSSLATAATFTRLALPEMRRHGYDLGSACGSIAAAGTLAALIPPSGMMVIFCVLTNASLGRLMIAGIVPGLLTAACFILVLNIFWKFKPHLVPPVSTIKIPMREKMASIKWTGPLVFLIVVILGGIYLGVFTPTEAGAIGGLITFIFLILRKGWDKKAISDAMLDSVRVSAMIFLIIIGAMFYGRFMAVSGLIEVISNFLLHLAVSRYLILVLILFVWLVMGCFMEAVAIMALTLPIFYPILMKLGFDESLIGILTVMVIEIGVITPPVGTNCYVVKAAAGDDITLDQVFRGILPTFIGYLVAAALVVIFPIIALWLPGLMWTH